MVENGKLMSFATLAEIVESNEAGDIEKEMASFLTEACSDWPVCDLKEPNDLVKEIRREIDGRLTYECLSAYANRLRPEADAWKMAALTALLEFFRIAITEGLSTTAELEDAIAYLASRSQRYVGSPNIPFDTDAQSRRST